MSEAITNHVAGNSITAKSAGSQPAGVVHPLSIQYLQEAVIPTDGLQSQSWDELVDFKPDVVISVCDSVAGEVCPVWFGKTVKVHWGLIDPSNMEGTAAEKAAAFRACIAEITARVQKLLSLAAKGFSQSEFKAELAKMGAK